MELEVVKGFANTLSTLGGKLCRCEDDVGEKLMMTTHNEETVDGRSLKIRFGVRSIF
jgi:hypothetical protein